MEDPSVPSSEDLVEKPQASVSPKASSINSVGSVKRNSKIVKSGVPSVPRVSATSVSSRKSANGKAASDSTSSTVKSTLTKPTISSSAASLKRRNSTGGVLEKKSNSLPKQEDGAKLLAEKRITRSVLGQSFQSLTESRRASLPSVNAKTPSRTSSSDAKKPSAVSPATRDSRTSSRSEINKPDTARKSAVKPSLSVSASKRVPSSSLDSSSSSSLRRTVSKVSSPLARSPSITSGSKFGSLSSSVDRGSSSLSGRRKASTPDSRDSRFMMLPQVETKAGDDVRLDLRGHRIRSLDASTLNLSPTLEFVYLRDNLLSSLGGIEILKRVKVLDLSFNDFKGPGFEPLENCKALQFLSVAQNRLRSLSMASQPRLQVLAASKNKISTLKGFPHLPVLETLTVHLNGHFYLFDYMPQHLRVEENPILEMPHLEAASILLVGPTLKKFNDRDLSREELEIAKHYPAHTALCIRDGWEFCRPDLAAESTFRFLVEQWQDHLPLGFIIKEASVDPPFEEDACRCHFIFVKDRTLNDDPELVLKYQWYIGEKTPTNFVAIPDAVGEVYWPRHEDIDKFLKVECTPVLRETEYPSIFAVSAPVSPGTGYPKVLNLSVKGELVEGNTIKGFAEVAWCGGTPGKGVASWLRRRWNGSPVVIVGAEDEEYCLTIDDIDSSLVFMYTPVTEEGAKGEPQYAMTDFVKAASPSVSNVQIIGDVVEGNTIKGAGEYFGGREGPSKFEWLRENKETGDFVLVSSGTAEYNLTKEDVGHRLAFVYMPINFEGQEGKSTSVTTEMVKQAPPKVTHLKIIGDLREGNKVTVAANVTGGTEGSSRVQWFKTGSLNLDTEDGLEAVTASKVAKAFRIPLSAVGYYIVAKFTPMAPDGECGEPVYAISEKAVETLPPSLNFLSVTGDYSEGEILTASYGYIGGHEGKSLYSWYLHEIESDAGVLISEASGLLQYRVTKDAIGKFISFQCTPVRNDGSVGEPRICLGQERILGKAIEGTTLQAEKKYWGGDEGNSIFHWFLVDMDRTQHEIKDATDASYTLSRDDIGFQIFVSCEPVRSDWARGPIVLSELIGPILPGPPTCHSLEIAGSFMEGHSLSFIATYSGGYGDLPTPYWVLTTFSLLVKSNGAKDKLSGSGGLDLTLEDVGRCIKLVYTPVRSDGLRGIPKSIITDTITPGKWCSPSEESSLCMY
ncbi:hypothetical protein ACLOJK_021735 [Asimina triloba]